MNRNMLLLGVFVTLATTIGTFSGASGEPITSIAAMSPKEAKSSSFKAGVNPQGQAWELLTDSMTRKGDFVYFWVQRDVPHHHQQDGVTMVRERWITDCTNARYDIPYWEEYINPSDKLYSRQRPSIDWQPIRPNSIPDTIYHHACHQSWPAAANNPVSNASILPVILE